MTNPRRTNGSRRDKLRRRILKEEQLCHLCNQHVDVRLPHGLPGSPEIDELVPVTYGGSPYDRANCRLSHRHCNRLRWHGPIHVAQAKLAYNPPRFGADGNLVTTILTPTTSRDWATQGGGPPPTIRQATYRIGPGIPPSSGFPQEVPP